MATPAGKSKLRFGPFELDPVQRELRQCGKVVKLQQQQVSVLLLLVERAGLIVSREEIHQRIWGGDTFVDFERGSIFPSIRYASLSATMPIHQLTLKPFRGEATVSWLRSKARILKMSTVRSEELARWGTTPQIFEMKEIPNPLPSYARQKSRFCLR